jgi:RimJ/RimL family protein N-acetyltransferase
MPLQIFDSQMLFYSKLFKPTINKPTRITMTDPGFLEVPPMLVVETERLHLRTVRVADAAAILPIITDETTMKFTSGVVANDLDVATRWLSARALGQDVLNFVITLKDGGLDEQVVGIMGSHHWPEIGYLMNPGM